MTPHHPIAIVGAGLAGLMLARVLRIHGIEATLYERDASPTAHGQGGMLDIHHDSGQVALRAAGLTDGFTALIHRGGEAIRIVDQNAAVRFSNSDDGTGGRPEVNRGALRALLVGSLPDNAIRWGSKVTEIQTLSDGRHAVSLADGATFTASLLVGADGAWSKVRPRVSSAVPEYLGVSFVEVELHDADLRHPQAAALVGGGVMFALGEGKGIIFHREPDGRLHGYIALKVPASFMQGVDFTQVDAAKEMLQSQFSGWHPSLRSLIAQACGPFIPRLLHALPSEHRWDRVPGVTLAGDAAHLMSPFAGEGANLALQDGAELALALVAHPGHVEEALGAYERALFLRSAPSAAESAANLELAFRPDAPQGMLDSMAQHGPGAPENAGSRD